MALGPILVNLPALEHVAGIDQPAVRRLHEDEKARDVDECGAIHV